MAEAGLADKSCAVVNIYDTASLKRRKMLALPDLDSLTIANIAFSGDGRFCLTLGGSPDWKLVLWTAERVIEALEIDETSVNSIYDSPWKLIQT